MRTLGLGARLKHCPPHPWEVGFARCPFRSGEEQCIRASDHPGRHVTRHPTEVGRYEYFPVERRAS